METTIYNPEELDQLIKDRQDFDQKLQLTEHQQQEKDTIIYYCNMIERWIKEKNKSMCEESVSKLMDRWTGFAPKNGITPDSINFKYLANDVVALLKFRNYPFISKNEEMIQNKKLEIKKDNAFTRIVNYLFSLK